MISGKSALRKNRLKTGCLLEGRVATRASAAAARVPTLLCFGDQVVAHDPDVGEVAVALREVEAVPDHEAVRDLEADVAAVDVVLTPLRLRQERADLERRGPARLEVPERGTRA